MRALALIAMLIALPAQAADPMPYPPESRWPSLPRLAMLPSFQASTDWVDKARDLHKAGTCTFKTGADKIVRVEIPFILLLSAKGAVLEAHVAATGCPELETYILQVVRRFGPKQIAPPVGPPPRWRGSRFLAGWQG